MNTLNMLLHINIEFQNIRDENCRNLNVYQNLSLQKTSFRILRRIEHSSTYATPAKSYYTKAFNVG